ncbi:MAG TPA: BON domain-containing protein [Terriglobales bacterium]|nr:BON domain-containing protein [Terriglobales bacterium]
MKKLVQTSVFLLAISTGIALAQAGAGATGAGANSGPGNNPNGATQPGASGGAATMPDQTPSPSSDQDNKNINTHQDAVDDQTLHREVHEQLATNPDLQNVQVEVNNGVVKLTGSVPNKDDKKEASKLVKSVAGVKKVKENLTVASNANGPASSSSVGSQSGNGSTTGANNGGTGEAGSSGTMNENPPSTQNPNNTPNSNVPHNNFMADDQAGSQSGSSGSATGSEASQSSTTGANGGAAESSDQVKNDIQTAFHNEPTLTSSNIAVDVTDSKITLSGTAPSEKDRDEARRIAQSFSGNRSIVDNVKVEGAAAGAGSSSSTPDASSAPNNPGSNAGSQTGTSDNNPEQPNTPKQ